MKFILKFSTSRGLIQSLLTEIHKCVLLGATEDIVPTRISLSGGTIGAGDLQSFISYIKTKQNKLNALGDPLKESELVGIFSTDSHPFFTLLWSARSY